MDTRAKVIAFFGILLLFLTGSAWGLLSAYLLEYPYSIVVSLVGVCLIGWVGIPFVVKKING